MKPFAISIIFFLHSFYGKSQLYYNFSATAGSYTPLVGGSIAPLSPISTSYPAEDEGFSNNIPIGFNFQYNGIKRSTVNVNTNGFVTFGDPFFSANFSFDFKYYNNDLTNGPLIELNRPIIAPLWDDLGLIANNTITYKTEGTAPIRVFTLQ